MQTNYESEFKTNLQTNQTMDIIFYKFIVKLSARDMIAQKAKYHLRCLSSFYWKVPGIEKPSNENDCKIRESMVFAPPSLSWHHDSQQDKKEKCS